ncbi:MAG TPA: hypothetical protein VGK21_07245, partial [Candidatus Angelobacter sp.]
LLNQDGRRSEHIARYACTFVIFEVLRRIVGDLENYAQIAIWVSFEFFPRRRTVSASKLLNRRVKRLAEDAVSCEPVSGKNSR